MKKIIAILGALLLVALGFMMPRIAAAYQDRSLEGDVRRMENAPVSLALTQELVELPELDLVQSLELFTSPVSIVELEEGRCMSAEDALQIARELVDFLELGMFYTWGIEKTLYPTEAVPFLLTDLNGQSGIFWRCGWGEPYDDAVWIDDQNRSLAGFCLEYGHVLLMERFEKGGRELCLSICQACFPPEVEADVFMVVDNQVLASLRCGEEGFILPMYLWGAHLYFNYQLQFANFYIFATSQEPMDIAGPTPY